MTVALVEQKLWTYEDYLELPDDGNRYEIIQGEAVYESHPFNLSPNGVSQDPVCLVSTRTKRSGLRL